MPKGRSRTQADYDEEIEKTANRMRKKPEALRLARYSSTWYTFLEELGIDTSSSARQDFFGKVRDKLSPPVRVDAWSSYLQERNISAQKLERERITIERIHYPSKEKTQVIFRDARGRFAKQE